jgi:hypothetical protein
MDELEGYNILGEISQIYKDKYYIVFLACEPKKKVIYIETE